MADRDELPRADESSSVHRTYTGRFRLEKLDDDDDGNSQPPSYVPSAVARKMMKGSKRGRTSPSLSAQSRSSQTSNPIPQPTYRIIRGPPSDAGPSTRHNAPSHMSSRSISVPSESEPPSTSVTRVPSPDWEAPAAGPSSSRTSPWGMHGSPSPRRRVQASKLRTVTTAPIPASPQYETESDFPPASPYNPQPPSTPPPNIFPSRSAHPSVSTPLRHTSLPPSSLHHSGQPIMRHPSLPPISPSAEFSSPLRHPSVPPSTPPSTSSRGPSSSSYTSSPLILRSSSSANNSLSPRSHYPSLRPRPPQPPQPSASPPPLPSSPPIAATQSASTSASTSTAITTVASSSNTTLESKSDTERVEGELGRPPTEAVIHCQWEACRYVITGIQNFGKHLKQEHKLPVVQHGRQSGPMVRCRWMQCGTEIAGLELYIHILQVHLKFGYHCRGLQKDGMSRCDYRPVRLDTLERHYKAIHPGEKRQWDETILAVLPSR